MHIFEAAVGNGQNSFGSMLMHFEPEILKSEVIRSLKDVGKRGEFKVSYANHNFLDSSCQDVSKSKSRDNKKVLLLLF